jgi:hypothetical protein
MQPYYFPNQEMSDDIPLPKRPANCQVNHLINYQGEILRNPIGRGWSKTPLDHPITTETLFGVIEIVALPHAHMDGVLFSTPPKTSARTKQEALLN